MFNCSYTSVSDSSRQAARLAAVVLFLWSCAGAATTCSAQGVTWKHNLKQAAREAKASQKPLLLKFSASWCRYCDKMLKTTFRDEGIARHINGCFVPVSVDYDRHGELVKAVGVKVLPTTVVISPELNVVRKITGYQTPAEFQRHLKELCPHRDGSPSQPPSPDETSTAGNRQDAENPRPSSSAAFGGRCLVSMLDDRKHRRGDERFGLRYRGKRLVFASAEYRKRFLANPKAYWPANDGLCPVSLHEQRERKAGQPRVAVIYRNKLWFFATAEHRKRFAANPSRFATVRTAERPAPR